MGNNANTFLYCIHCCTWPWQSNCECEVRLNTDSESLVYARSNWLHWQCLSMVNIHRWEYRHVEKNKKKKKPFVAMPWHWKIYFLNLIKEINGIPRSSNQFMLYLERRKQSKRKNIWREKTIEEKKKTIGEKIHFPDCKSVPNCIDFIIERQGPWWKKSNHLLLFHSLNRNHFISLCSFINPMFFSEKFDQQIVPLPQKKTYIYLHVHKVYAFQKRK